ncbi:ANTAR domain-containing protein [Streptomyces antimycoticus]|uniref:ANTAR domain-containing protein n=1 Tax=Streptomyces antimycoticus TaxID=68175 RepID=UPI0033DA69F9
MRTHALSDPAIAEQPLVRATVSQLLAGSVLAAFPNTALIDPTAPDRNDAHPGTLQRALSHIDDHADQPSPWPTSRPPRTSAVPRDLRQVPERHTARLTPRPPRLRFLSRSPPECALAGWPGPARFWRVDGCGTVPRCRPRFPIERQYVAIERDDLLKRIVGLEEEVAQLRRAMASRAVIDQAIGVAITHGSLLPDQGWGVLRTVSQTTNIKVRLIAEQIVRWPHSGRLPEDIRQVLEAAPAHLRDSGPHPHRTAQRRGHRRHLPSGTSAMGGGQPSP